MKREEEISNLAIELYNLYAKNAVRFHDIVEMAVIWADEHQPSPWISVDDRLPEDNGKYYVLAAGIPDMALYKNGKWVTAYKERKNVGSHFVEEIEIQDFEYSHTDLTDEITHWMPIIRITNN